MMLNTSDQFESELRMLDTRIEMLEKTANDPDYKEDEKRVIKLRVEALKQYRELCETHLNLLESDD